MTRRFHTAAVPAFTPLAMAATGLRGSNRTASSAGGTGTSEVQSGVPNCASERERATKTTIKRSGPVHAYLMKLTEYRGSHTESFHPRAGHTPDIWPAFAS